MVYGEEFFYGGAGISSCPPVKSQPTATLLVLKIGQALKHHPQICLMYSILCCLWALTLHDHGPCGALNSTLFLSVYFWVVEIKWPWNIIVLKRYICSGAAAVCAIVYACDYRAGQCSDLQTQWWNWEIQRWQRRSLWITCPHLERQHTGVFLTIFITENKTRNSFLPV